MSEGRVLVVDDNPIVLDVMRATLAAEGFEVETEESVFRMSAAIRRQEPELILLDVKMPALSGPRAAAILQQHRYSRDIPVLFFSDLEVPDLERLAEEAGVAGFISKATEKEHLVAEIRRWIDRPSPAAGEPGEREEPPGHSSLDEVVRRSQIEPLVAAGGDLLERMIAAFERQLEPRLGSLRTAAAAGTAGQVGDDAHFLKGSCRSLGAQKLVDLLEAMELAASSGHTPSPAEVEAVVAESDRVTRALREILEQQAAPAG